LKPIKSTPIGVGYFFTEKQNISIDIRIKKAYNKIKVKVRRLNQSTILTERTRGQRMSRILDRRKVVKRLKKEGWKLVKVRGKGSHEGFQKGDKFFPFPQDGKTVRKGTLGNIERITGIKF
jgi:predicted RNA binding protein YcfA (HicA-like mRNA interferase family)